MNDYCLTFVVQPELSYKQREHRIFEKKIQQHLRQSNKTPSMTRSFSEVQRRGSFYAIKTPQKQM
jgi:hypothetical protein